MTIYKGNQIIAGGNLPTQTGKSGKFLKTDGSNPSWESVDALPSQSGQNGKYLTTNGTQASWGTIQQAPSTDNTTINQNSSNQLQAIGVIDGQTGNADKFVSLTKAQYDALATKDADTFYNITDDSDVTLNLLQTIYPVGSIYLTFNNTCPLSALFGTWQIVGTDKVLQGAGTRGAVGTTLNESLPNIKGRIEDIRSSGGGSVSSSGSLVWISNNLAWRNNVSEANVGAGGLNLDASRSSSTYQDNAPVQQDAILVNIFKRIA